MVHKDPMGNLEREGETLPGGRPGPRLEPGPHLEPGPDGGLVGERTKKQHAPPPHPVGPVLARRPAGVGCAATWVAVKVRDLEGPDLGSLSDTSEVWWGLHLSTVSALIPYSWTGVGLYSSPELARA